MFVVKLLDIMFLSNLDPLEVCLHNSKTFYLFVQGTSFTIAQMSVLKYMIGSLNP